MGVEAESKVRMSIMPPQLSQSLGLGEREGGSRQLVMGVATLAEAWPTCRVR